MSHKKNTLYLVGAAIAALFLFRRSGGNPPPPPPPLVCPVNYASDGTKCVPVTPPGTQSWSYLVDINDVETSSLRINASLRIPAGFTGCVLVHAQITNAVTHDQVTYEVWQNDFSNYGGGYRNINFFISGLTPLTLHNVFTYATSCTMTERYTGVVFQQVRTR